MQALRVDWPVYPRRAEHNTVAEGGNRRWAETARQNAFQSRWPRPTRGPPAKASAEIDVAAVTVEGTRRQGPNGPAHPIRRLVSRLPRSQAGMKALRASGASSGPPQDRAHLGAARCGGRVKAPLPSGPPRVPSHVADGGPQTGLGRPSALGWRINRPTRNGGLGAAYAPA